MVHKKISVYNSSLSIVGDIDFDKFCNGKSFRVFVDRLHVLLNTLFSYKDGLFLFLYVTDDQFVLPDDNNLEKVNIIVNLSSDQSLSIIDFIESVAVLYNID